MSDDLNKKIKQIAEILGGEDIPDNVKQLISSIASSSASSKKPSSESDVRNTNFTEPSQLESPASDNNESLDIALKLRKIIDKAKHNNDPRVSLLKSVKHFLSPKRQGMINNCIKMLFLLNTTSILDSEEF